MKFLTVAATIGLGATAGNACLLESEKEAERHFARHGFYPEIHRRAGEAVSAATFPIGTADRFNDGEIAPVGLGVDDRDLESLLNVEEAGSALRGLAKEYPEVQLFEPPFTTYENRPIAGAVVGDNPRVMIMSGIHARERGGPDNVIYFLADLLAARKAGSGITYGGQSYTAGDVETALSAGIVVLPNTNPDGVAHDQATGTCWRKNRNPASSGGSERDIGIDLNRNFDFVWDFETAFSPEAGSPASNNPGSETFCGTAPASEPETEAVVWTLDQYSNITWFMDLHSYAGSILYAWGDDDAGTDTAQTFVSSEFDGTRGVSGDTVYNEYFTEADLKAEEDGTTQMLTAMNAAGDVAYDAYPAVGLYPTSGASNDYAMGRYYGKLACGSSRMFGLTLEFGTDSSSDPSCPFYPSAEEYHQSVRQVGAGFMEMMLLAAGPAGEPVYLEC